MTATKQSPVEFFFEHAGYSYDPETQTREEGRRECAELLAAAERWASDAGLSYHWEYDGMDSSEWDSDPDPWPTWECVARDMDGEPVASLGGIDFGRDGEPWNNPHRRVIEAELASQAMPS